MTATVLLSMEGARALGGIFGFGRKRRRAISGSVLGYHSEGVWFQDNRLLRSGQMALIKWRFVEAMVSDAAIPQPSKPKPIGFVRLT